MIDVGKKNVLGVLINAIDYEAAVATIIRAAHNRQALSVSALAVHGVMTGVLDETHRHRLNQLDMIVPDGQPVRWALNLLHDSELPDRVYGPTLMLKVCQRAAEKHLPIYLYGSRPEVLTQLRRNLGATFPGLEIAGAQPSRFKRISSIEKQQVIDDINDSGAAITFVGLGCPRQETWVYEYRNHLHMPIIAVGAAFDFHAGTLPQAPTILQQWGLEWLFRFAHEPRRLWKRYMLLNPLYALLLGLQLYKLFCYDPSQTTPPTEEMRYG